MICKTVPKFNIELNMIFMTPERVVGFHTHMPPGTRAIHKTSSCALTITIYKKNNTV